MKKPILIVAMTAALVLSTASGSRASSSHNEPHAGSHDPPGIAKQLAELKRATARNRKVANALHDGFEAFAIPPEVGGTPTTGLGLVGDPTCFDSVTGGMGVHYVKGIDGDVNLAAPEAMVYEIRGHHLKLVAVEYIVPETLVDPANLPVLFGQEFHHHDYLPVYILHVWAWKHNPNGLFADFNPTVKACPTPAG